MGRDLEAEYRAEACDQAADQPQIAGRETGDVQFAKTAAERRLGAGRVGCGVEQLDELRMGVGRRGRIVDAKKIDALSAAGMKGNHRPRKSGSVSRCGQPRPVEMRPIPVYCAPGTNRPTP